VGRAGIGHGLGRLRLTAAHQPAHYHEGHHDQQRDHQEIGHLFAQTQMREQGRQTQTGRQAGDRAHPGTLAGRCTGCRRRGAGWRGLSLLRCCIAFHGGVALHAGGLAAAHAFGLGIGDR
jgi:hypothetical protein